MSKQNNRLPDTTFDPEYPNNKVWVFQDGTEVHVDTTTGKTRLRVAHGKTGTYMEIGDDGKTTVYTVGDTHMYHKSGVTSTVDNNGDMQIAGVQRLTVQGGSHIEVRGDAAIAVGGDSTTVVAGNMQAAVAGDGYMSTAGHMNMNFSGDLDMKVGGKTTVTSGGDMTMKAPNIHLNP